MTKTSIKPTETKAAKLPVLMNATALGLLAGISFGVHLGLAPALCRMDGPVYLATMHSLIPAFTHAVVPLMAMGFVTFVIRLFRRPPCANAYYLLLVSFAFFLAGALITVFGHFPINGQFMQATAQNPPVALDVMRNRWNELDFWRFTVAQISFLATLGPLVFEPRAREMVAAGQAGTGDFNAAPGLA